MSSKEIAARTAGNFAYQKLVEARPEYTKSVRDTLMALIRGEQPDEATVPAGLEVNAALSTLGQLQISADDVFMFRDLCLTGGDFSASSAFKGADFQGTKLYAANFTWAKLQGARFNGALLADHKRYGEDLIAHISGHQKIAEGWWGWERYRYIANFDNSDLTDAGFEDTSVAGASFKKADLRKTRFYGSNISRADFDGAQNIDPKLFDGACFGSTAKDREHSAPRGLPSSLVDSLGLCKAGTLVDDAVRSKSCPRKVATAQR